MKQTYALVFFIIATIFLGYKFVEYRERVHSLKEDIAKLEKDKKELVKQSEELKELRASKNDKVKVVYRTIYSEKSECDDKPIGDSFIDGMRKIAE